MEKRSLLVRRFHREAARDPKDTRRLLIFFQPLRIFAMLILLLTSGCDAWYVFTPERAVLQQLYMRSRSGSWQISTDSIQILQQKPWHDEIFTLAYYTVVEEGGQEGECMVLYRVAKEGSRWSAMERSTSCEFPAGTSKEPMMYAEQLEGNEAPNQSTYLIGVMRDGRSVAIEIEWEDGEAERVDLVNGSFLVLREGEHRLDVFRGLDAEGTPVVSP